MKTCARPISLLLLCLPMAAQTVRFSTNLGDIDVTLLPQSAPRTVENFLSYVNRGAYSRSFFHRLVPGFVLQGGGFRWQNNQPVAIASDAPVRNEYAVSNTRGTIAMAKLGTGPDTATNQWFFNLANNAANLNNQNGGFTVFGRVANAAGLNVMDRLAATTVYNAGSPFDSLPLVGFSGSTVQERHLLLVTAITILDQPSVSENGVVTATAFGGLPVAAPGSFIEIYGSNLGGAVSRGWAEADFVDGVAPASLEGVSVTVGGQPAFVNFVSPNQVNVQVPSTVTTGGAAAVIVTRNGQASPPVQIAIEAAAPALLAPVAFRVGEKQFVAAFRSDGSFVTDGTIPGIEGSAAAKGETLLLFGTGWGPVEGSEVAGRVAAGAPKLVKAAEFRFGDSPAAVLYAGLAPGFVGLYQFNVTVPGDALGGDVPLRVLLDGQPISQGLWISLKP